MKVYITKSNCSMGSEVWTFRYTDIVHLYCNAMKVLCNEISGSSDRTSCQIPDKLRPNSAAKQSLPHQRQLHLNKSMRMARPEGGKWVILLLMLYSQKPKVEYLWRSVKGERRVMQKPWWWRGSWAQTLDLGITQPAGPYHQHSKNQRKNTKNTWKIIKKTPETQGNHRKHRKNQSNISDHTTCCWPNITNTSLSLLKSPLSFFSFFR